MSINGLTLTTGKSLFCVFTTHFTASIDDTCFLRILQTTSTQVVNDGDNLRRPGRGTGKCSRGKGERNEGEEKSCNRK